ncbi:hypothetical protein VDG1235_3970 [Verrucomicrobiia bacterium DG1235]|nr:hypothetical protein VDG1235_3970 [Verrucomicrobiae bacterium DG1235]
MTNKNNRLISYFAAFALLLGFVSTTQAEDQKAEFGPYVALTRDANIVRDVKVEENGRIYLLLNPDFKEKEIILKNSTSLKSGYRKWFNDEYELVSAANQGKAPNEYTDWVTTSGNYVEYYMEGKLILHLAKKSVL